MKIYNISCYCMEIAVPNKHYLLLNCLLYVASECFGVSGEYNNGN